LGHSTKRHLRHMELHHFALTSSRYYFLGFPLPIEYSWTRIHVIHARFVNILIKHWKYMIPYRLWTWLKVPPAKPVGFWNSQAWTRASRHLISDVKSYPSWFPIYPTVISKPENYLLGIFCTALLIFEPSIQWSRETGNKITQRKPTNNTVTAKSGCHPSLLSQHRSVCAR